MLPMHQLSLFWRSRSSNVKPAEHGNARDVSVFFVLRNCCRTEILPKLSFSKFTQPRTVFDWRRSEMKLRQSCCSQRRVIDSNFISRLFCHFFIMVVDFADVISAEIDREYFWPSTAELQRKREVLVSQALQSASVVFE